MPTQREGGGGDKKALALIRELFHQAKLRPSPASRQQHFEEPHAFHVAPPLRCRSGDPFMLANFPPKTFSHLLVILPLLESNLLQLELL